MRRFLTIGLFAIFGLLSGTQQAIAQTTPGYQTISIADGLSQGMVFDIIQDEEGFLWIATKNGLNRYDGYSFRVFTNDPYNAFTLSGNTIVKLFEDSKGRIWVGTENSGVNVYDKNTGKFHRILHKPNDPSSLSGNAIRSIEEMPDGRILVSCLDAGFNIISLKKDFFDKNSSPAITRLTLPNNAEVYAIGKDQQSNIWICGMDKSVYRFNPLNNGFIALPGAAFINNGYYAEDKSVIINSQYFLLTADELIPLFDQKKFPAGNLLFRPNQKLWVNYHRELQFYDISLREEGKPLDWTFKLPLDPRPVYPYIIDRSGILWSGSVGYGLRKYNLAGNRFQTRAAGNSIRFIVPVGKDDLILSNYAYDWFNMRHDSLQKNVFSVVSSISEIDNFIVTKKGNYWIKSDNSGYYQYNPASKKLTPYPQLNFYSGEGEKQVMIEDRKGMIWMPGIGGMITRIHPETGFIDSFNIGIGSPKPLLPKATSTTLYEDKLGNFWIGTIEGFVKLSFNQLNKPLIRWYTNSIDNRNTLNYNNVSAFLDDPAEPEKYLWICTKGGGLNRLNKITGDFFHFTSKDGLPDDVVYGLLPDDAGNLWGSTNRGIFCLLPTKEKDSIRWQTRNFTRANGLQDDEFNTNAYTKLPNGLLAFGGVNGLNIFDPKEALSAGFTPRVFITSIMVNNKQVKAGDASGLLKNNIESETAITLNHLQDILTLEFASLDLTAPNQNRYRYQLEGADKDWIESGSRRTATYLHLPPGKYRFKVQGSNSQGIWSPRIAMLDIQVLPPWWNSWFAWCCYALLLLLGISAYFRFSVNRAKLKSQLSFEQREAKRIKELDSLKTQLYTNITHEFRTPLTVILGMARQVASNPAEHLKNGTDMIIRNGESLLKLVNEMLDLSKLETGKMNLQLETSNVIQFLNYIVESFNSLAESQHKQLHFLSTLDSLVISYDPEKLRQIIANLLSNAIKFTPEKGNIYLSIHDEKIPGDPLALTLVIKVKDTGIGIPESQQQHIFERFYQLDNSQTRKMDGTGIGLSLTKELVKLMDGTIEVKSPPTGASKGTEFTVSLPVRRQLDAEDQLQKNIPVIIGNNVSKSLMHEEHVSYTVSNDKPLILLVEDNADVVAYTASCLPDYRLAVGKDGQEGFDIARELIPDLIITDVMMPHVDGFEMCRRLRKDEHTSHIPIVMLTARAGIESRIEGFEQGADAYLEKPFHKEELLIRIKKLLELRTSLQQFYSKRAGINASGLTGNEQDETLAATIAPAVNPAADVFIQKLSAIIEEHINDEAFTVEQLCRKIFMSHSQLHRKLDALTGCSPNKFIRMIRLKKAIELLKDPSRSITSIAMECGYSDSGYFARVFKQEYGMTAQEWRNGN
jgi:signal transduction histidine kinase/CheY-like chemotaxis protein/AraC-like DNA-binding protein/streptogramin lyase